MRYLKKMNPLLIVLMLLTPVVYVINMVNAAYLGTDVLSLANELQSLANLIGEETAASLQAGFELLQNATNAYIIFQVIILCFGLLTLMIGLGLMKIFVSRILKSQSVFNFVGLIASSGFAIYLTIGKIHSFGNLSEALIVIVSLLILAASSAILVIGLKKAYDYIRANYKSFEYQQIAFEFAKILAFALIIITGYAIISKIVIFIAVSNFIGQIDLAGYIDIMNYLQVDLLSLLPPAIANSGLVTEATLEALVNGAFDTYVLSYVNNIVREFAMQFAGSIIFNNLLAYGLLCGSSFAVIFISRVKSLVSIYTIIGLSIFISLIVLIYFSSFILTLFAIGFGIITILLTLELVKRYY